MGKIPLGNIPHCLHCTSRPSYSSPTRNTQCHRGSRPRFYNILRLDCNRKALDNIFYLACNKYLLTCLVTQFNEKGKVVGGFHTRTWYRSCITRSPSCMQQFKSRSQLISGQKSVFGEIFTPSMLPIETFEITDSNCSYKDEMRIP